MDTAHLVIAGVAAFCSGCVLSLVLTPLVRRAAIRLGVVDRPDRHRKLHSGSVALCGGVAVFLATAGVLAITVVVPNPWNLVLRQDWREILAFGLACATIVLVGTLDDCVGLRGRQKLLGQLIAAGILMTAGLVIEKVGLFGHELELGMLSVPLTLLWLVGAVNAVNLLDGIDGLATVVGIILSATIAALASLKGNVAVGAVALVFAGSLTGFLRYNFPPARMFLGDSGSMLIGLIVGALAIRGSLKSSGTVLLAAPLAVWTVPIFDSAMAVLRRKLTGRSLYVTDRGHLHHRLLELLGTNRRALAVIAVCCALTCGAALVGQFLKSDLIAVVTGAGIVLVFVVTGTFGRTELQLAFGRAHQLGVSLVRPAAPRQMRICQSAVRLHGSRQSEWFWAAMTEVAEKLSLTEIRLDVNHPAAQEGYNASWKREGAHNVQRLWHIELPLLVDGRPVGSLRIEGERLAPSLNGDMEQVLDLVHSFEQRIRHAVEERLPATEEVEAETSPVY